MGAFSHALGEQLRRPQGAWGRLAGAAMRWANREPNRLALTLLDVRDGDDVLELGFGPGEGLRALSRLSPRGNIHGVDQSVAMLAQASARNRRAVLGGRMHLRLAPFLETGLPSCSVDRILAVNVAYFWFDGPGVLAELHRVLRPGGRVGIYVTDASTMARWAFASSGSHRIFDADQFKAFLADGPFSEAQIAIRPATLRWGVSGLTALITKPAERVAAT